MPSSVYSCLVVTVPSACVASLAVPMELPPRSKRNLEILANDVTIELHSCDQTPELTQHSSKPNSHIRLSHKQLAL